jgi:succinyl-CoA synthetase alpha subunit
MGIIVNSETRVLVQGITGGQGSIHTALMQQYGTKIVAGTSPGKGGANVHRVPVYDTVQEATSKHAVDTSIIFVPAPFAADAAFEALEEDIKTIVMITEHVPIRDAVQIMNRAAQLGAIIVGPNTPGVITPGQSKVGILPAQVFQPGHVGVISRSGTLTYEIAATLTQVGLGQSTCLGIGGDPVTGLNFVDALKMFLEDKETQVVALIGEIGGNLEENAAQFITETQYPKPIVAYIAGRSAPPGKRMGHAGAIITGTAGTATSKIDALEAAGVKVASKPSDVASLLAGSFR